MKKTLDELRKKIIWKFSLFTLEDQKKVLLFMEELLKKREREDTQPDMPPKS